MSQSTASSPKKHTTYTAEEYTDMHFLYGLASGSSSKAAKLYQAEYKNRRHPTDKTFTNLHLRLSQTGCVFTETKERGCTEISDEDRVKLEEKILEMVQNNPRISTREIANRTGASRSDVWRILSDDELHPHHLLKVQHLLPEDFPRREEFCRWLHQNRDVNQFILYTDEAQFTRSGFFNIHNEHIWARENPRATVTRSFQERFSVNVWIGIVDGQLIGPHYFEGALNSEKNLNFLRNDLPQLIEDNIPITTRQNLWYMHDGAPAHRSRAVTEYLNRKYPNRWIGFSSPSVKWPARSPDLTPCDFSIWGQLKAEVYKEEIMSKQHLIERINNAFIKVRADQASLKATSNAVIRRAELCFENGGGYFENEL